MLHEKKRWREQGALQRGVPFPAAHCEPARLIRHSHGTRPAFSGGLHQQGKYRGMKVKRLVYIDMIESQAGTCEGRKLRVNLRGQLAAHSSAKEIADAPG